MTDLDRGAALDLYVANFDPTEYEFLELAESLGACPGEASLDRFLRDSWMGWMVCDLARGLGFEGFLEGVRADDGLPVPDGSPERAWLHGLWDGVCRRHPYYADSMRYFHEGAFDEAFARKRLADEMWCVARANVRGDMRGRLDGSSTHAAPYEEEIDQARNVITSEMLAYMDIHQGRSFDDYLRHLDVPADDSHTEELTGELSDCWKQAADIRKATGASD